LSSLGERTDLENGVQNIVFHTFEFAIRKVDDRESTEKELTGLASRIYCTWEHLE
jgi:hypothetical protein